MPPKLTVIRASAHHMPQVPDRKVQVIATSPPYFNLRSYAGEQDVDWPEVTFRLNEWVPETTVSAMRCALGNEPNPVAYVAHLILCMREWRRVLRDDGTVWVNLGDGWANDGKWGGETGGKHVKELHGNSGIGRGKKSTGLKPKDKLMIPALFAQAARADGWWLRFDASWIKRNGMPSSQTDRPTVASETIFLFSKSERYYYDQIWSGVPSTGQVGQAANFRRETKDHLLPNQAAIQHRIDRKDTTDTGTRYRRDTDWFFDSLRAILDGDEAILNDDHGNPLAFVINTAQYKEAHYAVWPEDLVIHMLRASTSEHGCCPTCGAPWQRVVEKPDFSERPRRSDDAKTMAIYGQQSGMSSAGQQYQEWRNANPDVTTGWTPTCTCVTGLGDFHDDDRPVTMYVPEPVPCTILDPFAGSGTTAAVALGMGLDAIACDISQEYIEQHITARAGNIARILAGEFKQLEGSHDDLTDLPLFQESL